MLGDRVQLAQVVINLVVNAIHAMSQIGDRRRLLSITSKTLSEDSNSQMAVLEVEDTGTGIDPKIANNLFTAFHTTKADGMGVGLSISRTIVDSHGGSISVTSGDRCGALFKVRLPVLQQVEAIAATDRALLGTRPAIIARRHSNMLTKASGKMALICKTRSKCDFRQRHFATRKQMLGPLHALPYQVVVRRGTHGVLEGPHEVADRQVCQSCQQTQR